MIDGTPFYELLGESTWKRGTSSTPFSVLNTGKRPLTKDDKSHKTTEYPCSYLPAVLVFRTLAQVMKINY